MNIPMPVSAIRRPLRPLGFYPAPNSRELLCERMDFQAGVRMLNAIVENVLPPARSNTVISTLREDGSRSVCSDRYNPQAMNDANFAKNFNTIANRVASRSSSYGRISTCSSGLFSETSVCSRFRDREHTDMCKLQCEILGPHLCADCIRIQRVESVNQEKNNMYPQIKVDTRSLVAPGKVQQFNSNLPSQFYNEKRSLECGCVVRLDRNFWNPVIYTQANVFDRLRQANRTNQLLNPIKKDKQALKQLKTLDCKRPEDAPKPRTSLPVDIWTFLPVRSPVPRYDMKVTVTFAKRDDTDVKD